MTDPISDMLTRIRNAAVVNKTTVELPHSKIKFAIAKILESEGYLENIEKIENGSKSLIRFKIKFNEDKSPVISSLKRISRPGRRVYIKSGEISKVRSGFGFAILSTPNGLMTSLEARKRRLGGEIICEIY